MLPVENFKLSESEPSYIPNAETAVLTKMGTVLPAKRRVANLACRQSCKVSGVDLSVHQEGIQ